MAVYVVCEGERGSIDIRLLDAILAQHHGLPIQVEPGGGKRNLHAIRAFLEARTVDPGRPPHVAIAVEDRDYSPLTDVEARWSDPACRALRWRWHQVENFLVAPWVLDEAFRAYRGTTTASWVGRAPRDRPAVDALLHSLAPRLFNEHVAQEVCATLRALRRALGAMELNVPRGVDPVAGTADQWRRAIQAEIDRLQSVCASVQTELSFQPAEVLGRWSSVEAQVHDPAFLSSGQYLRDLKGKRLLDLLWNEMRGWGCPIIKEDLEADLIVAVRRAYGTSPRETFPDLEDLATRIRGHLGL